MGIFNKAKTTKEEKVESAETTKAVAPKPRAPKKVADESGKGGVLKGKSNHAYNVLVKPLITEKASSMGAEGKYVFSVNPSMNKIEVKKAIRAVYNVNPVSVRMINVEGKRVRQGRTEGKKKDWKKAIVTLREGEKIEVYEGV